MGLVAMAGAAISGLTTLRDAIALIRGAASTPERQRQLAGTRLHEAVDEIARSFEVIEGQLVALLAADVTSPDARRMLIGLEGGSARLPLASMRGHCSTIGEIWEKDLSTVFQRLTSGAELAVIEDAFRQLDNLDGIILRTANELAVGLAEEAAMLLDAIDRGTPQDAQARQLQIRAEVRGLRQLVNETLAGMVELKFVLRKAA